MNKASENVHTTLYLFVTKNSCGRKRCSKYCRLHITWQEQSMLSETDNISHSLAATVSQLEHPSSPLLSSVLTHDQTISPPPPHTSVDQPVVKDVTNLHTLTVKYVHCKNIYRNSRKSTPSLMLMWMYSQVANSQTTAIFNHESIPKCYQTKN